MNEKLCAILLKVESSHHFAKKLTCFSNEYGLCRIYLSKRDNKVARASNLQLSEGEFEVQANRAGFLYLQDFATLDLFSREKWDFAKLEVAGELAASILHSQVAERPSPMLYLLFRNFLRALHSFDEPGRLLLAFRLKLLFHEGVDDGESWSPTLRSFAEVRSMEALQKLPYEATLLEESRRLFQELPQL